MFHGVPWLRKIWIPVAVFAWIGEEEFGCDAIALDGWRKLASIISTLWRNVTDFSIFVPAGYSNLPPIMLGPCIRGGEESENIYKIIQELVALEMGLLWWNTLSRNKIWYRLYSDIWTKLTVQAPDRTWDEDLLPFKKTNFFPLYVVYVDEIFNAYSAYAHNPHISHISHTHGQPYTKYILKRFKLGNMCSLPM